MFKPLDDDTYTEFQYRLNWCKFRFESPENAVPERLGWSYWASAGGHYCYALYCLFLEDKTGFNTHLAAALKDIKTAIPIEQQNIGNFTLTSELSMQYSLCSYTFVGCCPQEVTTSCQTITCIADYEKYKNDSSYYYHSLAHLWLDMPEKALTFLPGIEKAESRKNAYTIAGTADVIRALASKDMPALIHAFDVALQEQHRRAKAPRSYLYNNMGGFIWLAGLELAIVALKYGLDVTPHLSHNRNVLKVKTESPLDRTELPANKRFNVPVEYIPEPILAPWRQYFLKD